MGYYATGLITDGFVCDAYDGNPNTFSFTNGNGPVLDLSIPIVLNKKYDWVLSLEVGEHIPAKLDKILFENWTKHASLGIVLSCEIPGQKVMAMLTVGEIHTSLIE